MEEKLQLVKLNKDNYPDYASCILEFKSKRFSSGESFLKECSCYLDDELRYAIYLVVITYDDKEPEIVAYFALSSSSVFWITQSIYPTYNPCAELSYFSLNDSFSTFEGHGIGLGRQIFIDFILPTIINISKKIGISYITLFSLPNNKVIQAYKDMGFNLMPQEIEQYIRYYEVKNCKLMVYNLKDYSVGS